MPGVAHLVKRFFGSLVPVGLSGVDATWAEEQLLPAEVDLWKRMSRADRRHAVGVARRVERALGAEASRPVVAAALLHDCGKTVSGLGTYGRVIATKPWRGARPKGSPGESGCTSNIRVWEPTYWASPDRHRSPWPGPPNTIFQRRSGVSRTSWAPHSKRLTTTDPSRRPPTRVEVGPELGSAAIGAATVDGCVGW
jgi:hypothetical protein